MFLKSFTKHVEALKSEQNAFGKWVWLSCLLEKNYRLKYKNLSPLFLLSEICQILTHAEHFRAKSKSAKWTNFRALDFRAQKRTLGKFRAFQARKINLAETFYNWYWLGHSLHFELWNPQERKEMFATQAKLAFLQFFFFSKAGLGLWDATKQRRTLTNYSLLDGMSP